MLWEATLRPHTRPGGPLVPLLIVLAELPASFYSKESASRSVWGLSILSYLPLVTFEIAPSCLKDRRPLLLM